MFLAVAYAVDRQPSVRFDLVRQILYFWRHARFRAVRSRSLAQPGNLSRVSVL
jgi:hypothetical protein